MKKQKKMRRLNRTIARITMIGYSAVLVILLLLDWYMIRNHQENLSNAKRNILNAYTEQVKTSIDKVDQFLYDIYSTDKNFQALQREQSSAAEYGSAYELREKLRTRIIMQDYLSSFYIFYGNGEKCWYGTQEKFSDFVYSQEIKKMLEQYQANASQGKSWSTVSADGKISLFVCYKKGGVSVIGVYTLPDLAELIEKNTNLKAQVCIVQNGDILSGKKQANQIRLLGKISGNEDSLEEIKLDYQLFGRKLSNMDFWICTVYPVKLWQTATALQILLLLVTLLSVFAVFVLFVFVRRQVVQPLRQLTDTMNRIRNGETREVPEIGGSFEEFAEVRRTLEKMVRELEEQKNLTYEEIIEKQKAQMQYLQLQLKPHFYLNGLKTVNALAMAHEDEKIQELVLNLSEHLRYLLRAEQETVPLSRELAFVENYIGLQKHVTGRPVTSEITVDPEVEDWQIPILSVQTFVENSIKYAKLGDASSPLEIQITASYLKTEDGDYLDLVVQDNGQGYSDEILEEINGDAAAGRVCVGINNIKRRCGFLYGDRAEYLFENNEGAVSELILPRGEAK